ncbi:hypothetical protein NPIL_368691 [Nephila pilipes]|uniref:Uncharacterized protein n=1 Tax=Nephila pilipes TaxID=299642 RepID=A0A8X6U600_NEPPI|nr:hypothetical protein NPIL_368691 [Nephila pilipes]
MFSVIAKGIAKHSEIQENEKLDVNFGFFFPPQRRTPYTDEQKSSFFSYGLLDSKEINDEYTGEQYYIRKVDLAQFRA